MTPEEFEKKQGEYLRGLSVILKDMPKGKSVHLSAEACALLELNLKDQPHTGMVAEVNGEKEVRSICHMKCGELLRRIEAKHGTQKDARELLKEAVKGRAVSDDYKRPAVKKPEPAKVPAKVIQ